MLYEVYAALGVNSWSWHGHIQRVKLNLCFLKMVELRMRDRNGESRREHYGGYEWTSELRGTICLIECRRPRMGVITHWISSHTCHIMNSFYTCTQSSLKSWFPTMIHPISSHFSVSHPQLYHHLRTQSEVIPLYPSIPWWSVNTTDSIHLVLNSASTVSSQLWLSPTPSQPPIVSAWHIVLNFLDSQNYEVLNEWSLSSQRWCPPVLSPPDWPSQRVRNDF